METLLERASRAARHHPAPALPLDELQRLVRGSGVVVGEEALVRALFGGPDRFRIVDPWRGPWAPLRRWIERRARLASGRPRSRRPRAGRADGGAADAGPADVGPAGTGFPDVGRRWVIARPGAGMDGGDRGSLRRMRHTLAHLGWTLDDGSPREMARWCLLVREGDRVRDRVRGAPAP